MKDAGWPETVENVQIFYFACFIWLFCQYLPFLALHLNSAGCSHVGALLTTENHKNVGWQVFDASFPKYLPCLWCHWCRLLGTRGQHSWSCFGHFQMLVFNKRDDRPNKKNSCLYVFYSVPIDKAHNVKCVSGLAPIQ